MRVLVAGGTGRLGTLVVRRLVERETAVRVLTRDPRRADHLRQLGVEVVEGDVRQPASLVPALQDVDLVVSAVQGFAGPGGVTPESVDRDGNVHLMSAAERAGAAVVLVSIVGSAADSAMELFRCKHEAERQLQASRVPWTIVRSVAFLELWADLVGKGVVFGRGDNPINFVSVEDVADVVTEAVLDPSHRGQVFNVVGPQCLSFNELAAEMRQHCDRPVRLRHIPRWLLRGLAPLHRQPRAALVMDTVDMTFAPLPEARIGTITAAQALARSRPSR
jgi:NADH dehydrogenase